MNSFEIKRNNDINKISSFISNIINKKLKSSKQVLWFISGGSFVPIEVEISKKIQSEYSEKLVITLVDERYGPINHVESNWLKLKEAGFEIKKAKFIPVLLGESFFNTTICFNNILKEEFNKTEYKIGLFGVGKDGHTAGILPNSKALNSTELVCSYEAELYNRITITPKAICMLDEAIVYTKGEEKWPVIENLYKDIPVENEPIQILKKVPLLTIFTDYKK